MRRSRASYQKQEAERRNTVRFVRVCGVCCLLAFFFQEKRGWEQLGAVG